MNTSEALNFLLIHKYKQRKHNPLYISTIGG